MSLRCCQTEWPSSLGAWFYFHGSQPAFNRSWLFFLGSWSLFHGAWPSIMVPGSPYMEPCFLLRILTYLLWSLVPSWNLIFILWSLTFAPWILAFLYGARLFFMERDYSFMKQGLPSWSMAFLQWNSVCFHGS